MLAAFAGVTCAAYAFLPMAVSLLLWVGLGFLVTWAAIAIVSVWRWSPRVNLVQRIWAGAFLAYLLVALIDTFVRTSDGESSGLFVDRVRAVVFVVVVGVPLLVFVIRGRIVDVLLTAMRSVVVPLVQSKERGDGNAREIPRRKAHSDP